MLDTSKQPVLLLAGGNGRRFGSPKLFAKHQGVGFLERILTRCAEGVSPVCITLQPQHALGLMHRWQCWCYQHPSPPPWRMVYVAGGDAPMLSSVQAGLCHLLGWRPYAPGCWLWPVDAPFLSANGWAKARHSVQGEAECVWKLRKHPTAGEGGHPLWLPRSTWTLLMQHSWEGGVKQALQQQAPNHVQQLILAGEALHDVDHPYNLP